MKYTDNEDEQHLRLDWKENREDGVERHLQKKNNLI